MSFQVQIITTKDNIIRPLPTFILPELLGLLGFESALKTVKTMFIDYEVHGSILNMKNQQVFTF